MKAGMGKRMFSPAESHKLEDPERLAWMPPDEILAPLNLEPGMIVADIGAGTGFFAIPIARAVCGGKVFAVDVQPEMLDKLRARLDAPCTPQNIELVRGDAVATGLPPASCDVVFLANVWHEFDDRCAVLAEAERILRPGGRVAILDWRHDADHPPGPPLDQRVPMRQAIHTLEQAGWELHHFGTAGRYSYLLVAALADQSQQS
jgi:ubiquinone/menaquinone biosynthesis C-methylase UbiE